MLLPAVRDPEWVRNDWKQPVPLWLLWGSIWWLPATPCPPPWTGLGDGGWFAHFYGVWSLTCKPRGCLAVHGSRHRLQRFFLEPHLDKIVWLWSDSSLCRQAGECFHSLFRGVFLALLCWELYMQIPISHHSAQSHGLGCAAGAAETHGRVCGVGKAELIWAGV